MRVVLTLALLLPSPAMTQTTSQAHPLPKKCQSAEALRAGIGTPRVAPRKLGEMPPARAYYTVLREVDGCPHPVAVRDMPKR